MHSSSDAHPDVIIAAGISIREADTKVPPFTLRVKPDRRQRNVPVAYERRRSTAADDVESVS